MSKNHVEELKAEKDGLDVLEDIKHYAQQGGYIDEDTVVRMKWYGLYTQKPGTIKDEIQYFMLRVKLVGGKASAEQLRVIGELSEKYGRNSADITTRQDIQIHWLLCRDLPAIFEALAKVGISTQMAAGDCPRNTVTCPICDVDSRALVDTTPYVKAINDFYTDNRDISNLPRKFKVGLHACEKECCHPETQDLGFSAIEHEGEVLFDITVGGGLSKGRRIATPLGYAVHGEDVVEVTRAVSELYRDNGNRENRSKARLRHLIEEWGVDTFREAFLKELRITPVSVPKRKHITPASERHHYGIHPSKEAGKVWIGTNVFGGVLSGTRIRELAELMEKFEVAEARMSVAQNILFTGVPEQNADAFVQALEPLDIHAEPENFHANMLTCTGNAYCKFALTETKQFGREVATYLDQRFPSLGEKVRIHINACPNSCAQAPTGDFGLVGCKIKTEAGAVPGHEIFIGGFLQGESGSHLATKSGLKVVADEIPQVLGDLVERYLKEKQEGERIGKFLQRLFPEAGEE